MKKIISGALSLAMILSMGTNAFAANITTNGGSNDTLVTYGMNQGFTVTIPADFDIDTTTKKATANVSASNVMIPYGSTLEVTVSGHDYNTTGSWELVDEVENTNMLTYTIGSVDGGNDIVNGSVVLSVDAGDAHNETVTETMHFTVVDELTKAGTYKDTLTFTVGVSGTTAPTSSLRYNTPYVRTYMFDGLTDEVKAVVANTMTFYEDGRMYSEYDSGHTEMAPAGTLDVIVTGNVINTGDPAEHLEISEDGSEIVLSDAREGTILVVYTAQ